MNNNQSNSVANVSGDRFTPSLCETLGLCPDRGAGNPENSGQSPGRSDVRLSHAIQFPTHNGSGTTSNHRIDHGNVYNSYKKLDK